MMLKTPMPTIVSNISREKIYFRVLNKVCMINIRSIKQALALNKQQTLQSLSREDRVDQMYIPESNWWHIQARVCR
jgi:hypothetical protein